MTMFDEYGIMIIYTSEDSSFIPTPHHTDVVNIQNKPTEIYSTTHPQPTPLQCRAINPTQGSKPYFRMGNDRDAIYSFCGATDTGNCIFITGLR